MSYTVCGIDSNVFERGGVKFPLFKAAWGVGVTIPKYEVFKTLYSKTLGELLEKSGKKRSRIIYSSSAIRGIFNNPALANNFLDTLFKKLTPAISHIDIFYTWFPPGKPKSISIHGVGQAPVTSLPPIEFIEQKLLHPYPHICAWQYVKNHAESTKTQIFLDHFQGELTPAWLEIANLPNISVFLKGDECNFAIATADLALSVINRRLLKEPSSGRRGLYPEHLKEILQEFADNQIHTFFLGQKFLMNIAPISPTPIALEEKIKHPIIFLVRERQPLVTRYAVENSPLWCSLSNLACKMDGTIKLFDAEKDSKLIQQGVDFMCCMGPEGKKAIECYQLMGFKVKILDSNKVLTEKIE